MRFHLFPFRTEKLSSLTPMVLRFARGRVGSRLFKVRQRCCRTFFLFSLLLFLFPFLYPHFGSFPLPFGSGAVPGCLHLPPFAFGCSSIRVFEYLCPYAPLFPKSQSPPVFLSMKSNTACRPFCSPCHPLFSSSGEIPSVHYSVSLFILPVASSAFFSPAFPARLFPESGFSGLLCLEGAGMRLLLCSTWVRRPILFGERAARQLFQLS